MTDEREDQPTPEGTRRPSLRERTRPIELLGIAAVLAVFIFLISWMSTRDVVLALVFAGLAFIVALVVLAMLALAVRPDGEERAEIDLPEDRPDGPAH